MIKFPKNDDSEDDSDFMVMRQLLPTFPIPRDFNPAIPPTTAEEYMIHVLHESKKLGTIFTAKTIDESVRNVRGGSLPAKSSIRNSENAPSTEWQQEKVEFFSKLRNRMLKLRLKDHAKAKIKLPSVEEPDSRWLTIMTENEPLLSVMFALRQGQLERALRCLANESITVERGAWVYAIAANLDHPLSREACGDLRDIARKCAQLRDYSGEMKAEEEINMLNLIITIVVEYFQQKDLCED